MHGHEIDEQVPTSLSLNETNSCHSWHVASIKADGEGCVTLEHAELTEFAFKAFDANAWTVS